MKGKKDDMNEVMNLLDREISIDGGNSMDKGSNENRLGPYHMQSTTSTKDNEAHKKSV